MVVNYIFEENKKDLELEATNLSQNSAESTKNTNNIIEESCEKINDKVDFTPTVPSIINAEEKEYTNFGVVEVIVKNGGNV